MSAKQDLPLGIWDIVANGHRGELNITKVDNVTGEITGTARWAIGTNNEYIGNIFGFWDDIGWKITFLREHQVTFKDPNHPSANQGHHRDQVYTGYMWKGTTAPPPPPYSHCLAGSFIAFGGSMGSGGARYRSEFGWTATFPASTSNK
jgi:hypothetical protein